jgi:hypothetical protein
LQLALLDDPATGLHLMLFLFAETVDLGAVLGA